MGARGGKAGHTARLIPPNYVKPFVKRHKNDAVDAEAIVEAALRPSMSFVAVKTRSNKRKRFCSETVISFCVNVHS